MPTYDLTCSDCGNRFEKFLQRIIRDDDKTCPECGSTSVTTGLGGGFLGSGTATSSSRNVSPPTCAPSG